MEVVPLFYRMKVNDFNLKQTLECGQCFYFERIRCSENDDINSCSYEYKVVAKERVLHIAQEKDELFFLNADGKDIEDIWLDYFDLRTDYSRIKNAICGADKRLVGITEKYYGIRILNQDFVETLISFIISQNKSIPQIMKLVRRLSESCGKYLSDGFYSFPDISRLSVLTEQDFRDMKMGFRAPYLKNAADMIVSGAVNEVDLRSMDFERARDALKKIKGVGDKVANCVLLFGLGFHDAFPVDVWIRRVMEEMYFDNVSCDNKTIEKFAAELFGGYGGYAQQYLFIYAREKGR